MSGHQYQWSSFLASFCSTFWFFTFISFPMLMVWPYHFLDLFLFLVESLIFLINYWLDNFSRFFIFGSLYNSSIYAAPNSLLLEPFWGKHYGICLQVWVLFFLVTCIHWLYFSLRIKPVVTISLQLHEDDIIIQLLPLCGLFSLQIFIGYRICS